jgi:hypothetical protein
MANPKLKVAVNKNPTKEGLKVQFQFPEVMQGDARTEMTQKLQTKLNKGLSQYNMTISIDPDVPYENVIGFMIPIADFKLLIKNVLTGDSSASVEAPIEAPAEAPAEEPIKEDLITPIWQQIAALAIPIAGIGFLIKQLKAAKDNQKQIRIIKGITGSSDYREFVKNDPRGPYTERQIEKILRMQDKPGIGIDVIGTPKKNPPLPKFSPNE